MKRATFICAITVASLGLSSVSFAQESRGPGAPDDLQKYRQNDSRRAPPPMQQPGRTTPPDRRDTREAYRGERQQDRREFYNARGPEFRHGRRIPDEFRQRQYVVSNYRQHRLPPPPRGHEWVQVGPDYVLIAIASGLIAQMVLGH
jgi:Ni/Co efflux regulator RcnB